MRVHEKHECIYLHGFLCNISRRIPIVQRGFVQTCKIGLEKVVALAKMNMTLTGPCLPSPLQT